MTSEIEVPIVSRVDMIVQHILKNKKLQLPKAYIRNSKASQAEYAGMEDELSVEVVECIKDNQTIDVFEPALEVQNQKTVVEKKQRAKATKVADADKEKKPSAYNIFVKDAVRQLQGTHQHLGSKERFQLAIQMWNEHKKNKSANTTM